MKLHRLLSYGLITAGTAMSMEAVTRRDHWDIHNLYIGIMLHWDDVQAVLTRALQEETLSHLLHHFQSHGATHLSIPELTLQRLLDKGDLSIEQGSKPELVYVRARNRDLGELVGTELSARLPHLNVSISRAKAPLISFQGDLPAVAEIGLGFDPQMFEIAHEAGLTPVARPIGYSWVQAKMIERTLDQAATLGAKIVAIQGDMTPGFEFRTETTIETLRKHRLVYSYFRESRHQRGDWTVAKGLAEDGLTLLAHEFQPEELLTEDMHTISYRWLNLALEAGTRLCSLRFFRVIHAADPLEALDYVHHLSQTLTKAGFLLSSDLGQDLTPYLPGRDNTLLAMSGLSVAGAAGLASDLLPLPNSLKLLGTVAGAVVLSNLPQWEQNNLHQADHHHHDHDHDHHHHEDDHSHSHDHHHDHGHHHHHHAPLKTAYASKGLALIASIAYPLAGLSKPMTSPLANLGRLTGLTLAGGLTLNATLSEADYLLGVEEFQGYRLDWLGPLGVVITATLLKSRQKGKWFWLPLSFGGLLVLKLLKQPATKDTLATLDRELPSEHTHHVSRMQQLVGDSQMALTAQPLRKWGWLAPLAATLAILFKEQGQKDLALTALTAATASEVATLTGFRNMQRPLWQTIEKRGKSWGVGVILALIVWLIARVTK